ncbi:unnamed protein product, partial [Scytosiphon promiscuus]
TPPPAAQDRHLEDVMGQMSAGVGQPRKMKEINLAVCHKLTTARADGTSDNEVDTNVGLTPVSTLDADVATSTTTADPRRTQIQEAINTR